MIGDVTRAWGFEVFPVMKEHATFFAAALFMLAACTEPARPVDHDAQGSWGQDSHGIPMPGNSFVMQLIESDGAITGAGSFAGEAGPYGGLTITGTVGQDSIRLQIVAVAEPTVFPSLKPDTSFYAGRLTTRDEVVGQRTRAGLTAPFDLVRLAASDPH